MAKRVKTPHQKRNTLARRAGFRNYWAYRKATTRPEVRRVLTASGIKKGWERYELAGLAANVQTLPGSAKKHKRTVDQQAGILSDAIRAAGRDPTIMWKRLGSPKKPKSKGS